MQTRRLVLPSAVLVAGLTVFAAPAVTTAEPLSPAAVPQPPPRSCTINVSGGSVHIQAGPPNEAGGPAPDFPLLRSGPVCGGLESCLEWQYLFTYTDLTPQKAALAVDTDITVQKCDPACQVTTHVPLVSQGERTLVFAANTTRFPASYFTPRGAGPGTMTASFVAKKGFYLRVGLCALAGADNLIPEENQAEDRVVQSQAGPCLVNRTIDANGRTAAIALAEGSPPGCSETGLVELRTAGGTALFLSGDVQITFEGTHRYCWASTTTGKMTCVLIPH